MNQREERIDTELARISRSTMKRLKKSKGFGILTRIPKEWHAIIKDESKQCGKTMSKILGEICKSFYGDLKAKQREILKQHLALPKSPENEFLPNPVSLEQKKNRNYTSIKTLMISIL